MHDDGPISLDYATPQPANAFAHTPVAVIVLVAALVPGLSSSLIRRTPWRCLCLAPIIPVAFLFFGPFWGKTCSARRRVAQFGVYPFVLTCIIVEAVSILLAIDDRKDAFARCGSHIAAIHRPCTNPQTSAEQS